MDLSTGVADTWDMDARVIATPAGPRLVEPVKASAYRHIQPTRRTARPSLLRLLQRRAAIEVPVPSCGAGTTICPV